MTRACSRAAVAAATLVCVQTVSAFFPPPAPPATVYYGTLTAAEEAQVQAWGVAYWNKVENGVASTMTFSNPAMNSHLFNPFRGTRATLESLKLLDSNDCDKAIAEAIGTTDAATIAKRQALKDAMCAAKFATDPVSNPDGTTEHVVKILDAGATSDLVTYSEGGKIVSEKLPLDVVVAAGADPKFAANLSTETLNAINAIVVAAPGYAQTATGGTEAQKLLCGATSRTDQVEGHIRQLLADAQCTSASVDRLEAAFGLYESLPIVYIAFSDGAIIVDGLTGAVAGPYKLQDGLSGEPLLAAHPEFGNGTGSRLYTASLGCFNTVAAMWNPVPPGGTTPAPWGLWPWPTPMGQPSGWTCVTIVLTPSLSECRCRQTDKIWLPTIPPGYPSTAPTKVIERVTCTSPGACTLATYPPRIGSPSLPPPTWGCYSEYWY